MDAAGSSGATTGRRTSFEGLDVSQEAWARMDATQREALAKAREVRQLQTGLGPVADYLQSLKDTISRVTADRDAYARDAQELQQALSTTRAEFDAQVAANTELHRQLSRHNALVADLQAELQRLRRQLTAEEESRLAAEGQLAAVQTELTNLRERLQTQAAEVSRVTQELTHSRSSWSKVRAEERSAVDAAHKTIAELQTQLNQAESTSGQLREAMDAKDREIEQLKARLRQPVSEADSPQRRQPPHEASQQHRHGSPEARLDARELSASNLRATTMADEMATSLRLENKRLAATSDMLQTRIQQYELRDEELKYQLQALRDGLARVQLERRELSAQLGQANANADRFQRESKKLYDEVVNMAAALQACLHENTSLKQQLAGAVTEVSSLREAIDSSHLSMSQSRVHGKAYQELEAEYVAIKAAREDAEIRLSEKQRQLIQTRDDALTVQTSLRNQLRQLEEAHTDLQLQLMGAQRKVEPLQAELVTAQAQLASTQKENKTLQDRLHEAAEEMQSSKQQLHEARKQLLQWEQRTHRDALQSSLASEAVMQELEAAKADFHAFLKLFADQQTLHQGEHA